MFQIMRPCGGRDNFQPLISILFRALAKKLLKFVLAAVVVNSEQPMQAHAECASSRPFRFCNSSESFHLCWITEIRSLNLFVCSTFSSSAFALLIEMNFSFKSLFAIWSLSPQRLHYYFFLSLVFWQYQKYSTILILVLCFLCVMPLVCSSYSSFAPSSPFLSSWW